MPRTGFTDKFFPYCVCRINEQRYGRGNRKWFYNLVFLAQKSKPEEVELDSLWASQKSFDPERVNECKSKPGEMPVVMQFSDGRRVILDGHHRLVAAKIRGEKKALACVIPVEGE